MRGLHIRRTRGEVGKWSLVKTRVGARAAPQVLVPDIIPLSPVKWARSGAWIAYDGRAGLSIVSPDGHCTCGFHEPWIAFDWSDDGRQLIGIRQSDDYKHLTVTSIDLRSGQRARPRGRSHANAGGRATGARFYARLGDDLPYVHRARQLGYLASGGIHAAGQQRIRLGPPVAQSTLTSTPIPRSRKTHENPGSFP